MLHFVFLTIDFDLTISVFNRPHTVRTALYFKIRPIVGIGICVCISLRIASNASSSASGIKRMRVMRLRISICSISAHKRRRQWPPGPVHQRREWSPASAFVFPANNRCPLRQRRSAAGNLPEGIWPSAASADPDPTGYPVPTTDRKSVV